MTDLVKTTPRHGIQRISHRKATIWLPFGLLPLVLGVIPIAVTQFMAAEAWLLVSATFVLLVERVLKGKWIQVPANLGRCENWRERLMSGELASEIKITAAEAETLAHASFLGEIESVRDIKFLLETIRGTHKEKR